MSVKFVLSRHLSLCYIIETNRNICLVSSLWTANAARGIHLERAWLADVKPAVNINRFKCSLKVFTMISMGTTHLPISSLRCNQTGSKWGFHLAIISWMSSSHFFAPQFLFVYCFGLQNLRRHMCCRAIKTNGIGGSTRLSVPIG